MTPPLTYAADALVVLIGPAGSGKSTWASEHFAPSEVVSSDRCREMVCDNAAVQSHNSEAFRLFHTIIAMRLSIGKLTVADATNVTPRARAELRELAAKYKRPLVGIGVNCTVGVAKRQNALRTPPVPDDVIDRHFTALAADPPSAESWDAFYEVGATEPERRWGLPGLDVVSDVHGCLDELGDLLGDLGYYMGEGWQHPEGRKLAFVGDYTDRGPNSVGVLHLMAQLTDAGHFAVLGNHCDKLRRALLGNPVKLGHGIAETLAQIDSYGSRDRTLAWLEARPLYVVVNVGEHLKVWVTHAGIPFGMRDSIGKAVRQHALYGEVAGTDLDGKPIRTDGWTATWDDHLLYPSLCVYGHTVVPVPKVMFDTVNIDTGVCFGGKLTAMRLPEREFVSVPARQVYFVAGHPALAGA